MRAERNSRLFVLVWLDRPRTRCCTSPLAWRASTAWSSTATTRWRACLQSRRSTATEAARCCALQDGTGDISLKELRSLCLDYGHYLSDFDLQVCVAPSVVSLPVAQSMLVRAQRATELLDRNGDGRVGFKEFAAWWGDFVRFKGLHDLQNQDAKVRPFAAAARGLTDQCCGPCAGSQGRGGPVPQARRRRLGHH